ncbi:uncharacterized protein LOC111284614 [Durio zibethinus]|uniref:Uncharacterized protein LOC111284614 n=1 Tax=Durio zibethinus TaxID=66656 RepID=A0A6P5XLT5_DURZI|nr:uncharacterized protein LOC111284614 [Durio zibethinus]XP_022729116.1 uncharacterized protein LOC111284614 [Durio zibethinus]
MMTVATASNNGWRWRFPFPHLRNSSSSRRKATLTLPIKLHRHKENNLVASSNAKRASLTASRTQKVKLPVYGDTSEVKGDQPYHISHFLSHPSGIEAMLNTSALQNFEFLDTNAYRCTLPKLALFNFEATPVLDLRVIPTKEDCTVELFSCKFKGSKVVERQNDHFSATMINHITWDTNISEPFLEVDVKLNLSLEIYTRPFVSLPISAVERPGNLMIQALVDRLVPLLLQQLLQDYNKWVEQQLQNC